MEHRIISVLFLNWNKRQGRTDCRCHWFRFDNDFFLNPDTSLFTSEEKLVIVFMLCEASRAQKSGRCQFNSSVCQVLTGVGIKSILVTINKLIKIKWIDFHRSDSVRGTIENVSESSRYITLHNITEQNNKTLGQNAFDLESLYLIYPRKLKKKEGLKRLRALVKTAEEYEKVKKAVVNYAAYCSKHTSEPRFIMHFSTFVSSWEDWIDYTEKDKTSHLDDWVEKMQKKEGMSDTL